jgi:hypothetical protein
MNQWHSQNQSPHFFANIWNTMVKALISFLVKMGHFSKEFWMCLWYFDVERPICDNDDDIEVGRTTIRFGN